MQTQKNQVRPLYTIATEILKDWKKINFGARPYLMAMLTLNKISDAYGIDSAESIVSYFLSNAGTWRGETARNVKKELNSLIK